MIKIGRKIKQARKLKRITQEDLAQTIGVSDKSISAYESERVDPPLSVLERIAKSTDQPVGYFLDESEDSSILAKIRSVEAQLKEIKQLLKKLK
ncbi:MAG: Transcriptional regulator, XRE family [Candidatus Gottesmanbacteria bacterium GW2011_GWB1_43_11]|uniref:Transcriptional regulator, XRE family n=1 Tax=Candidatus Gottesmanbacteria bacterium GW2011_GWB1_43_11 TaxID=1618446 RepID=A0A0G1CPQ3_9BACT|nr:MAG: Transcriptional regulator, XRE family [Candidatus Gottesmanbacteria bacterium GW2011_GWA2_42_16]KKS56067.1 MAG: Transcriptional regulator, XRE family [Candidatus Gottesmanbacteria bacterium GW2011_GWA1_42_26]KKS81622.1 MAG: Transcriptional regulator, XRE family [Candidatus Gottesmanbacteria bacterium GW2011_GWC1_43_10]KKS87695.1 MAG: Transcriptional regulator, XRE family [Candidatus Gottesmanbacteria bacterium GW2011_GWB1_43_11]OGG07509.1 MAG: hypothetical protein A2699_00485 [Candidatu